jgi:hypothetical protein
VVLDGGQGGVQGWRAWGCPAVNSGARTRSWTLV